MKQSIRVVAVVALLAAIFCIARLAWAMTDYGCVNRCVQQGNMWGLCNSACSWN